MSEEKLFMPSYGRNFECIADKCPENCCVEWIVDLDDVTKDYYETAEGETGDKIRSHIVYDPEDDETIFTLEKGMNHVREWGISRDSSGNAEIAVYERNVSPGSIESDIENDMNCPFQRDDGLCEIRLKYGYEHTSETCREHPEFNEEYEGFTERSFSISCPEIARLISETPLKNDFDEGDEFDDILLTPFVYPSVPCGSEDPVLNALCKERNKIFHFFDEDDLLNIQIMNLRDAAFLLQPKLYEMDEGFEDVIPEKNSMFLDSLFRKPVEADLHEADEEIKSLLSFMISDLDLLTKRWENALKKTLDYIEKNKLFRQDFEKALIKGRKDISRVFAYFVYRYFLKAVNDCDIVKWSEFIIKCTFVPVIVSYATGMDFYRTAALYSREIEHDGDNAAKLLDMIF